MIIRTSLALLHEKAKSKPEGWLEMIKSKGVVDAAELTVTDPAAAIEIYGREWWEKLTTPTSPTRIAKKSESTVKPIAAIPRAQWPVWAKTIALLAKPEDRGVGDVVARTIGPFGGDAFKKWHRMILGYDCKCGDRQDSWNRRWPLRG